MCRDVWKGMGGVGGVKYHDKHWGICVGMHGWGGVGWVGDVGWMGHVGWWVDVMGGMKLHDKH